MFVVDDLRHDAGNIARAVDVLQLRRVRSGRARAHQEGVEGVSEEAEQGAVGQEAVPQCGSSYWGQASQFKVRKFLNQKT